jgi:hypothetical protein
MRNWKQIAALATVLAGLGALATWDEWKTKKEEKEKETKDILLAIKSESVKGLRLRSTGEAPADGEKTPNAVGTGDVVDVTLKLQDNQWLITSPIQTLADQQVVSDLLKNITEYKTESEVSQSKEQWGQFGLTNPRRDIEIETSDGKKTNFYVGLNTPVGFSAYTATSLNSNVYAGSQYIVTSTGKTLFDLREKKILSGSAADLTGLKITAKIAQKLGAMTLNQTDGKWAIVSPLSVAADTVAVKNYLDDIFGMKAAEFFDQPSKEMLMKFGDKTLFGQIDLIKKDATVKLSVYEDKDALYARLDGSPTIFKLGQDARSKVLKTAKDLRDKRIFGFSTADVSKVTIDGEGFTKVANDWYKSEDAAKFASDGTFKGKTEEKPSITTHVRGLVVDLEYARAEDIFDGKSDVAKKLPKAPKHRVILGFASGTGQDVSIDIWTALDNPEMIYLRRSGSDQIFKSKRTVIASFTPASTAPAGQEMMEDTPSDLNLPDVTN